MGQINKSYLWFLARVVLFERVCSRRQVEGDGGEEGRRYAEGVARVLEELAHISRRLLPEDVFDVLQLVHREVRCVKPLFFCNIESSCQFSAFACGDCMSCLNVLRHETVQDNAVLIDGDLDGLDSCTRCLLDGNAARGKERDLEPLRVPP